MGVINDVSNAANPAVEQISRSNSEAHFVVGVLIVLGSAFVGAAAYCAYRRLIAGKLVHPHPELMASNASIPCGSVKISHSLPDIKEELQKEMVWQSTASKKVLRQTTLPIVPTRHQSFQRQLSYRLDVAAVQLAACQMNQQRSRIPSADVGALAPELYNKPELERQNSSESSAGSDAVVCGKLHFTLRYDDDIDGLIVKVLQAKDLPAKDFSGTSDPYIKIYLLPDRKKKFQSKVHRKDLNPVFNETFIFSVSHKELATRKLQFSVYDFDRFSRHDLIGQVMVKRLLDSCDLRQEMEYIMDILSPRKDKMDLGELMLSLCYLPTAGRLTVTIIKARNLRAMDITGSSDPYVKVSLMCQGKRIKKKKTTVKKGTLNPVYNEALVFDIPADNVEDVNLLVKVLDYDRVGSNELLGFCGIGPCYIGVGRDHWLEMLDNPRHPIAQWYPLQETLPSDAALPDSCKPKPVHVGCLDVCR